MAESGASNDEAEDTLMEKNGFGGRDGAQDHESKQCMHMTRVDRRIQAVGLTITYSCIEFGLIRRTIFFPFFRRKASGDGIYCGCFIVIGRQQGGGCYSGQDMR